MRRAFRYFSIGATNVAQPLIFTTLTAAVPAGTSGVQTYAVADSSVFQPNDWAIIGSSAGGDEERVLVTSIVDATHIKVVRRDNNGVFIAHANGAFIRLSMACATVYVQTKDGNAAAIFVGTQGVTTAGVNATKKLQQVALAAQPTEFLDTFNADSGPNPIDVGEVWVAGTLNDQYLPSFGVV